MIDQIVHRRRLKYSHRVNGSARAYLSILLNDKRMAVLYYNGDITILTEIEPLWLS